MEQYQYSSEESRLMDGIHECDEDKIQQALDSGVDINATWSDGDGWALHYVAYSLCDDDESCALMKYLIKQGASVHKTTPDGSNILIEWLKYDKLTQKQLAVLVQHHVDVNCMNQDSETPLGIAFKNDADEELIIDLLKANANPNIDVEPNIPLLCFAIIDYGRTDEFIMTLINDFGTDIHAVDVYGGNALTHALETERGEELIKLLIDEGINVFIRTIDDETPLSIASAEPVNEAVLNLIKERIEEERDVMAPLYCPTGNEDDVSMGTGNVSNVSADPVTIHDRVPINIAETVTHYDIIEMEDKTTKIVNYINEDPDNIIIMFQQHTDESGSHIATKYALTKRNIVLSQLKNKSSVFHGCHAATPAIHISPDMYDDQKLLRLSSIGITLKEEYCNMAVLRSEMNHQLFAIRSLEKSYPTFVSRSVIEDGDIVSSLHCQPGYQSAISTLIPAYPTISMSPVNLLPPSGGGAAGMYGGGNATRKPRNKRKSRKTKKKRHTRSKRSVREEKIVFRNI